MNDDVENLAEEMHKRNPVTVGGRVLEWQEVIGTFPEKSAMFREAAANRFRAEEAMKRLEQMPTGPRTPTSN